MLTDNFKLKKKYFSFIFDKVNLNLFYKISIKNNKYLSLSLG